ncbi:hb family protein [Megaselia abdita]|uniref:Protein hunchback n=2 Tax=Megaselia abdita TaxID=88686 RepID=Q9N9D4_MEGAB|nr:putative hunchback [Megaselia abdita]ACD75456.1 putative hunchback [Megaselia abdita]CAC00483.1 Hunchback [Megaselia abdita]
MQNWESLQQTASYEHNWYGNMFPATQIKTEPLEPSSQPSQLEQYLTSMKQQQQHTNEMNSMTPSPRGENETQSFFGNGSTQLGFNPLTPPGLPSAVLPPISHFHHAMQSQLAASANNTPTPTSTPPMDVTPPKSPSFLMDTSAKDSNTDHEMMSNSSEDGKDLLESEDDEAINMPIYNSHGKMKNYKCKSCGFTAITKVSFWTHMRSHMKPEKVLQCPKCPFVTELKHHLEYHIRKHKNIKPFQCDKCNYSCVNKSMLNSHRKSHSSVYQYRCADCDYATKYCHSFKLHLRKYDHKPGMVLDEEGIPNPSIVIDVYGTRRGPKMKGGISTPSVSHRRIVPDQKPSLSDLKIPFSHLPTSPAKSTTSSNSEYNTPPSSANQMKPNGQISNLLPPLVQSMLQQQQQMSGFFPYWNLNLQMLAAQQQLAQLSPSMRESLQHQQQRFDKDSSREFDVYEDEEEEDEHDQKEEHVAAAIDLSAQASTPIKDEEEAKEEETSSNTPTVSTTFISRRKGRVLKLDTTTNTQSQVDEDSDRQSPSSSFEEPKETAATSTPSPAPAPASPPSSNLFECKYCDIFFKDAVLYTIHMGYHSCDDVFKCNMCGEKCEGPVGLFVHMARNAHS